METRENTPKGKKDESVENNSFKVSKDEIQKCSRLREIANNGRKVDSPTELTTFSGQCRFILKFIYDTNPFYLISAGLFLYSLTIFFRTDDIWISTAVPLGLIAAYTVLLVGTGLLIIRAGQVWDDARMILLIIVMLFMGLSFGMDGLVLNQFEYCPQILAGGLAFVMVMSELLFQGLKIRLPLLIKSTYYSIFGLFFAYQGLLGYLVTREYSRNNIIRGVAAFPLLLSVVFLLLIPVIRRGREYFKGNGTPWPWPWFPWTLFGFLGVGVCFRTYFMSISFVSGEGIGPYSEMVTGFGLYMLIPVFFVGLVLFLEHAIISKNLLMQIGLLAGPVLFFTYALQPPAIDPKVFVEHLRAVTGGGSSVFAIALTATIIYYVYAAIRKVKLSDAALLATVVITSLLSLRSDFLDTIAIPRIAPLYMTALLLGIQTYRKRHSGWGFAGWSCLVLALTINLRNSWFTGYYGVIPIHLFYACILLMGIIFQDGFAKLLQNFAAILLPVLFFPALFISGSLAPELGGGIVAAYLAVLMLIAGYGYLILKNKFFLCCGLVNFGLLGIKTLIECFRLVLGLELRGVGWLFWGAVFFLVALTISLWKGKIIQRALRNLLLIMNKIHLQS